VGILDGNPKNEPLHYGEIYGLWSHVILSKGMLAGYQTVKNHAGDSDLRKFIEEISADLLKGQIVECEKILKLNGSTLPPSPPERAEADYRNIPVGARFNDPEIAMMLSIDIASGLVACSQMIGQCVREDLSALFLKYHSAKAAYGLRLLRMNKAKGWLVPPPLQLKVPELVEA
jgi:hypothetical protein